MYNLIVIEMDNLSIRKIKQGKHMSDFSYKNILGYNLFRTEFFSKFRMLKKLHCSWKHPIFWNSVFFAKNVQFKEPDNRPKNGHFYFNLITQREIFLLRNIRYGMATILCWFLTILTILTIFGTKIQRSFKFLEGVMIYNYTSGLLLDYCFDFKFTHFEPFSLFCTIFALLLHYHIRYDLTRTS